MRSSSGCCPGLGKPLGFQPVFACVSKSLEESLTRIFFRVFRGLFSSYARNLGGNLLLDVADARNEIPMKYNL